MKRTLTVAALACLLSAVAGCGSSDPVAIPSDSTTTSTANPSNDAVLRDYRAFWADFQAVTLTMMPGNPRIAAHTTGDELTQLNNIVLAGNQSGTVYRGSLDLSPRVRSITGDTAIVDDCYIDRTGKYVVGTGERVDKEDLTPKTVVATLKNVSGIWMTASIDSRTTPCAPS